MPANIDVVTLARTAYTNLTTSLSNTNHTGEAYPAWDKLPNGMRDTWVHAIKETIKLYNKDHS
jgi:hypothetical protein